MSNNAKTKKSDEKDPLARYRQCAQVLSGTGTRIPRLLAERRQLASGLGSAEIEGSDVEKLQERLDAVGNALASAARQRAAACDGLLALADDLRSARAAAAEELSEIARSTITSFQERWDRAVAELSRLHSEAAALSRVLRTEVVAVPPYAACLTPDGLAMRVVFAGPIEAGNTVLPPEVSAITAHLDGLDAALGLCAAVAQAHELNQRHHALSRVRAGHKIEMSGLFEVTRAFHALGADFPAGALIDRTVLPDGLLYRFWQGRSILPLQGAAVAAA